MMSRMSMDADDVLEAVAPDLPVAVGATEPTGSMSIDQILAMDENIDLDQLLAKAEAKKAGGMLSGVTKSPQGVYYESKASD